jgi:hypothetical protein
VTLFPCPFCFRKGPVREGIVFSIKTGVCGLQRTCVWCDAVWTPCVERITPVGSTKKRACAEPATERHGSRWLCRKHLRRARKLDTVTPHQDDE